MYKYILLTSTIKELNDIDIRGTIINILLIIVIVVVVIEAIAKFIRYVRKPADWVHKNNKDHENIEKLTTKLNETVAELEQLKRVRVSDLLVAKEQIQTIQSDIKELKSMISDDRIARMRATILSTASHITNGQEVSKEEFEEALGIYDEYEKFLESHNMSNGRVNISIEIIKEGYIKMLNLDTNV